MRRACVLGFALGAILFVPAVGHANRSAIGQRLLHAMDAGATGVNIVVAGDSTGDEESEWVYQLALTLERRYPAYTVNYYLWDRKRQAWPSEPAVLQWGTSVLNVWNMSVSGSTEGYARTYAERAIVPKQPELLLVSYGHNDGAETDRFRWAIESLVDSVAEKAPHTEIALIAENPEVGDSSEGARADQLALLASQEGLGFVNVYGAFMSTGNPAAYLQDDGIHPNGAGTSVWLSTVVGQLAAGDTPLETQPSKPRPAISVIRNGDFSVFSRGQPAGWTSMNVRASKDYTQVEQPGSWAVRLTQTGGSTASYYYSLNARWLRGKWVTVAVRILVPDQPGDKLMGRVGLVDDRTGPSESIQLPGGPRGSYYWEIVTRVVDPKATKAGIVIYVGQQPGRGSLVVDRVIAVLGTHAPLGDDAVPTPPRSCAIGATASSGMSPAGTESPIRPGAACMARGARPARPVGSTSRPVRGR